jgi:hypothetical protein
LIVRRLPAVAALVLAAVAVLVLGSAAIVDMTETPAHVLDGLVLAVPAIGIGVVAARTIQRWRSETLRWNHVFVLSAVSFLTIAAVTLASPL